MEMFDCAIIGGGPAGLNAALVLGRAKRRVALVDNQQARNRVTSESHGYLTRDGIESAEFRRIAYEEVLRYPSVEHWQDEVSDVHVKEKGFDLITKSGQHLFTRKLMLAIGVKEILPQIQGLHQFYGKSFFNCVYCDGWELRDRPLVAIGEDPAVFHLIKMVYHWSRDVIVCTNGHSPLTDEQKNLIEAKGIPVVETPIASLIGKDGLLEKIQLTDGTLLERSAGFILPTCVPHVDFSVQLGYEVTKWGTIQTDELGRSTVPGLYAAGDIASYKPSQLVIAAASGSKAAMAVNADLIEEDF
jgi:thioredoxin reductase